MQSRRLDYIDALRGGAAVYVLLFHVAVVPENKPVLPEAIAPIILMGWSGVTLFFIVSAFTLCYTLRLQTGSKSTFKFFIRRYFRIAPLFYVWLMVSSILDFGKEIGSYKNLIIANFMFVFNFFPGKQWGIVPASWTLGVEMIFYVLFPFILYHVSNLKRAFIFLFLTASLAVGHYYFIQYLSIDTTKYSIYLSLFHQLPVFAVGIVDYYIYDYCERNAIQLSKRIGFILLFIGVSGFMSLVYTFRGALIITSIYPMALVYSLILFGLYVFPIKLFVNRISVYFGIISYSFYLNQPRIIYWLDGLYQYLKSYSVGSWLSYGSYFILTIIPIFMLSILTYNSIERPGILLGKKINSLL